jgi:hypothetical protein
VSASATSTSARDSWKEASGLRLLHRCFENCYVSLGSERFDLGSPSPRRTPLTSCTTFIVLIENAACFSWPAEEIRGLNKGG